MLQQNLSKVLKADVDLQPSPHGHLMHVLYNREGGGQLCLGESVLDTVQQRETCVVRGEEPDAVDQADNFAKLGLPRAARQCIYVAACYTAHRQFMILCRLIGTWIASWAFKQS